MRFAAYAGASTAVATAVVLRAFHQRPNFYSASVYLAQSQACRMILLNLLLLCVYSFVRALQKLLYGPLRPIEREQLWDRSWYAITETALAMTTFRDEVGAFFLIMFVSLLAGKVWGWISEGRVEILEQQPPANPHLFHARLIASLLVSELFDLIMLQYCIYSLLEQPRPGMMVMFAFEFAVLFISSTSTAARYGLSLHESLVVKRQTKARLEERREEIRTARREAERQAAESSSAPPADLPREEDLDENDIDVPGWQEKGRWILFLDLLTDFLKLAVYMMFFTMLILFHGIPIHIIRDVYLTARSFIKRISDFQKYRNATRDMNARYADATAEELDRDGTCIICREDMRPWQQQPNPAPAPGPADAAGQQGARPPNRTPLDERQRPKKLPCGHILHLGCLKSWLERQQVCPTCRTSVLARTPTTANTQNQNLPPHLQAGGPEPRGVPGHNIPRNGGAQRPANANQNGQGEQQARARTFNLGPWRFTFAAGNVNQVRGALDRARVADAQPPQANQEDGLPGGLADLMRRWRGQQSNSTEASNGLQEALTNFEALIARQINILQVTQAQLANVRALQGELTRLRAMQAQLRAPHNHPQGPNPTANAAGSGQAQPHPPPGVAGPGVTNTYPTHVPPSMQPRPQQYQQQVFSAGSESTVLGPDHPELPPGVTLPEGWSLLPLNRIGAGNHIPATAEIVGGVEVTPQISLSAPGPSSAATAAETDQSGASSTVQTSTQNETRAEETTTLSNASDSNMASALQQSSQQSGAMPLSNGLNIPDLPSRTTSNIPDWSQAPAAPATTPVSTSSSGQSTEPLVTRQVEAANGPASASEEKHVTTTANGHAGAGKSNGRAATVEDGDDADDLD